MGLVVAVVVHSAKIQDRDGAKLVFARAKLKGPWPRMQHVWADGGYAGALVDWLREDAGWELEIVAKPVEATTFVVLPKRWIVERTFAWIGKCRRLSKDYEHTVASSEALIRLAMIGLMVRRLTPAS